MTIKQLLREKDMTRYELSKQSGVSWNTLSNIWSGKTALEKCDTGTLRKLAAVLDIPMEQLLALTVESPWPPDDKLKDLSCLKQDLPASSEKDLPASLEKALREYLQGERDQVTYLDCLWCELYGAINSNQWGGAITVEQADYLRKKYLWEDPESQP